MFIFHTSWSLLTPFLYNKKESTYYDSFPIKKIINFQAFSNLTLSHVAILMVIFDKMGALIIPISEVGLKAH